MSRYEFYSCFATGETVYEEDHRAGYGCCPDGRAGPGASRRRRAGKTKAAVCAGCHGAAGVSANPLAESGGSEGQILIKQLKALRDGTRTDPMMSPMAKPLTDADIENLAAYFSSLKP